MGFPKKFLRISKYFLRIPKNTGVGLPFPSPGDLPDPGIEPASPLSLALAGGFTTEQPRKPTVLR